MVKMEAMSVATDRPCPRPDFLFTSTRHWATGFIEGGKRGDAGKASPRGIAYSYSSPSSPLAASSHSSVLSTRGISVVFSSVRAMGREVLKKSEGIIAEDGGGNSGYYRIMSWELRSQRWREFWIGSHTVPVENWNDSSYGTLSPMSLVCVLILITDVRRKGGHAPGAGTLRNKQVQNHP